MDVEHWSYFPWWWWWLCHVDLRRLPGSRLLEVVPPLEDPLARGEFEFRILILLLFRNQRTGSMTLTMRQSRLRRWFLIFDLKQILIYLAADRGRPCKGFHSFSSRTRGEKKKHQTFSWDFKEDQFQRVDIHIQNFSQLITRLSSIFLGFPCKWIQMWWHLALWW